ncbi:hypothetical protein [Aureimonas sp. AU12]|uniref:hypothetical protein n=1 Tax=Aureimonas sp. AU12 TaxID=1638161 RepID=UPI000780404A|nr:hypothetical protein [Aureimonas sp. AU12]
MKIIALASAAFVSLAALTGAASAAGIVPGSDHFTEARADYEANTVIVGTANGRAPLAETNTTRTYGYPVVTGSEDGIIPGSRTTTHAEETRDLNNVARGVFNQGNVATPVARGAFVPGSSAF